MEIYPESNASQPPKKSEQLQRALRGVSAFAGGQIEMRVQIEPLDTRGLSRTERIALLRGQLKLLRLRAEQGIPVSVAALERTEQFARTLEVEEVSA